MAATARHNCHRAGATAATLAEDAATAHRNCRLAEGRGDNNWKHNPQHRGGTPYRDRATADRFGGTTRGESLANRQTGARQQLGRQGGNVARPGGGAGLGSGSGVGNRSGGGAKQHWRPGSHSRRRRKPGCFWWRFQGFQRIQRIERAREWQPRRLQHGISGRGRESRRRRWPAQIIAADRANEIIGALT